MKLYSRPLSPYAAAVRAAAYLKNIPLKLIDLPYPFQEQIADITPVQRVPVFVTGSGTSLFEAIIIAEYLEEKFPEIPLLPQDPKDRALVRLLARMAELEVFVPALTIFKLPADAADHQQKIDEQIAIIKRGLAIIEERLTGEAYALGDHATLADCWLLPIRFFLEPIKKLSNYPTLFNDYPKFEAYAANARQDDALATVWNEMQDGLVAFKPQLA
ncbi:glutathione S-transferase family protein [Paenochrobactrum sp. BZR 588]|uniref:glutathione S-transferase family protein n=1 Tax=unclassified Paenochrobactrum TaxID=2639760 RepID=UPI003854CEFC